MRLPWPLLLAGDEDELLRSLLFGRRRELEEGRSYLMKEPKPKRAVEHFRRAIERGYRPLLLTRQHPNHVERQHAGQEVRVVWLSTTLGKDYMDPHNLNSLSNLISNFVADAGRAVILFDGVEYVMMNNDFPRLLNFVEYLNEKVAIHRAILILSLDARAFDAKDLANLERNMTVLE